MNIMIPNLLTEKDGLLYVRTHDANYVHQSWMLEDGKVVVFESIPVNYPSNALCVFDTLKEYLDSIKEVDWINDLDYVVQSDLEQHGFPFNNEEE